MIRETTLRLDELREKILGANFLKNTGIGNEIGFYIFDYNPKDELIVREYLPELKKYLERENI